MRKLAENSPTLVDMGTPSPSYDGNNTVSVEKVLDEENGNVCYVAKNGSNDHRNSPAISCLPLAKDKLDKLRAARSGADAAHPAQPSPKQP